MKITSKNTTNSEEGFGHLLLFIIILIVVGVIGFAGYRVYSQKKKNDQKPDYTAKATGAAAQTTDPWKNQCSGSGTVNLTHMPMNISDVSSILPVGTLAGAHVTPIDHLYFYPKDMKNVNAAPVYAMADGYIVSYEDRSQQQQGGSHAIRLVIQHNCSFYTYFDLMTSMDKTLEDKIKSGDLHVAVKAGQEIGRVGAQSLDTAVYNLDLNLKGFVKPESYVMEPWKIHTDDFFKYFSGKNRDDMLALNPRKVEPYGGKIDYDIAGKLVGNWFQEGTNGYAGPKDVDRSQLMDKGYFSGHLSIAPDAVNPSLINVSTGDFQGKPKQFTVLSPSKTPDQVGEGEIIKYELVQYAQPGPGMTSGTMNTSKQVLATAMFQVLPKNKLKMEIMAGYKASEVTDFSKAAKIYER